MWLGSSVDAGVSKWDRDVTGTPSLNPSPFCSDLDHGNDGALSGETAVVSVGGFAGCHPAKLYLDVPLNSGPSGKLSPSSPSGSQR